MEKLTGGQGWSLSPDETPRQPETKPGNNSPVAKIRMEKRMGKAVTVISGLHTYGDKRLEDIAKKLKTSMGAGGTVKNGCIEIQGDKVSQIKEWFKRHG